MRHKSPYFVGPCVALLLNCLSPPGKRVLHTEGFTATGAGIAGSYEQPNSAQEQRDLMAAPAANFDYGFHGFPLQAGLNIPGGIYFTQADLYINYLSARHIRLGAGGLVGIFSGWYHLVGFPVGQRHEFGIGIEYLRGNLFSARYPESVYAGWLQFWSEIQPRNLIGVSLQYQIAPGNSGQANCAQLAANCIPDLSEHGSIAMRISYAVRLGM